nr:hypothetical protein [Candidatus Sigynarchaeota archaeon]
AIGLKSLGAGQEHILEEVTREATKDYLKHTDEIKKKAMLEKEEEIKKLNAEKQKLQNELAKKTTNDIVPNEIVVEHKNSEED